MARRNRSNENDTISTPASEEATEAATSTESQEDTSMSTDTTEAPVKSITLHDAEASGLITTPYAPAEPEAAEPVKVDAAPDLTAFSSKVEEAVAGRDTESGNVPDALLAEAQAEYRKLDGTKAKNLGKRVVEEAMREAMNQRNIDLARAYMLVSDNLTAGAAGPKAERVPADPKEAFVQRFLSLSLALALVGSERPDGIENEALTVTDELLNQAQALIAWEHDEAEDKGDAPESTPVVRAAVKIAAGKAAKAGRPAGASTSTPFTGERRDIGVHITEAFAGVEIGTFLTVAQIRAFESSQYQTASPASAGAISARLFPASGKCTVAGVKPGQNSDSRKGAEKVA